MKLHNYNVINLLTPKTRTGFPKIVALAQTWSRRRIIDALTQVHIDMVHCPWMHNTITASIAISYDIHSASSPQIKTGSPSPEESVRHQQTG